MKDLITTEFNGLQNLSKNAELISQVSIDIHSNGLLRVTVISQPDIHIVPVDALLREIFPSMEYQGTVGEDETGDYYFINVEGESLVNLLMKKTVKPVEWTVEEILRREG